MASPQGQLKCVFAMCSGSHEDDGRMELYDVMRTTGAVRRFAGDPLPDDVLERILDNARFAPSGGNRQGVRVIAVRDAATRERPGGGTRQGVRVTAVRDAATRERLAELSTPGARRYTAQLANGEAPWNPLQP